MPRGSPQEPLCHAEHQTKTPALVRQIRHDHSFYPNRCRTGAGARSDDCGAATIALNNRIGSCGVLASAKSRKIRGTGPAIRQPFPVAGACARSKEKMAKELSGRAEVTRARAWPRALGHKIVGQDSNLVIECIVQ